uniref:Uncharacterized protein n=1 Tax=Oryza brachyantha TaxID=4533 RepID=J3NCY8_ORYBR
MQFHETSYKLKVLLGMNNHIEEIDVYIWCIFLQLAIFSHVNAGSLLIACRICAELCWERMPRLESIQPEYV